MYNSIWNSFLLFSLPSVSGNYLIFVVNNNMIMWKWPYHSTDWINAKPFIPCTSKQPVVIGWVNNWTSISTTRTLWCDIFIIGNFYWVGWSFAEIFLGHVHLGIPISLISAINSKVCIENNFKKIFQYAQCISVSQHLGFPKSHNISLHLIISNFLRMRPLLKSKCSQIPKHKQELSL